MNGNQHGKRYSLAEFISPDYTTFLKTIPKPLGEKYFHYAKCYGSMCKDIEQVFGVLHS